MFMNSLYVILVLALCAAVLSVIFSLGKKVIQDSEQSSSFECGFNSASQGLLPFSLQFYLIANVFLIFDVELILLFPILGKTFLMTWLPVGVFSCLVMLLSLGLFHEWNQKILDWVK